MGRGRTVVHQLGIALAAVVVGIGAAHATCSGDCPVEDDKVTIDELVLGINIVLGHRLWYECPSFDQGIDDAVTEEALLPALENALYGCGPVPPTATASATRTTTTTPLSKGAVRAVSTPGPNTVIGAVARHGRAADELDAMRSPFFLGLTTAGFNLVGLLVLYRRQRR